MTCRMHQVANEPQLPQCIKRMARGMADRRARRKAAGEPVAKRKQPQAISIGLQEPPQGLTILIVLPGFIFHAGDIQGRPGELRCRRGRLGACPTSQETADMIRVDVGYKHRANLLRLDAKRGQLSSQRAPFRRIASVDQIRFRLSAPRKTLTDASQSGGDLNLMG